MAGKKLENVPIFSVGQWNGRDFSREDLDAIVESFNRAGMAGRVPVVIGHQNDSAQPAYGWVQRVVRDGDTLYATFSDVPGELIDGIKQGKWRNVSVELLQDTSINGTKYPWLLDAVAVLGGARPAVRNLEGLHRIVAQARPELAGAYRHVFGWAPPTDPAAELRAENERLRAQLHRQSIDSALHMAQVSGQLSPAGRERFVKLFALEDAAAYQRVTMAQLSSFLASEPPLRLNARPTSQVLPIGQGGSHDVQPERADEALLVATRERMATMQRAGTPVTFSQATQYVLRSQPELARAYAHPEEWSYLPMSRTLHL